MTNDMSLQEAIQELKDTGIDFADSMKEILNLIKATFSSCFRCADTCDNRWI